MAVHGSSLLWDLSPCLHPHMAGISENPLFWCGGCMLCLMGTIQGLAVGTGLGMMLPLTLPCSVFRWPQSGFSTSLTICCMFYTQIKSLPLEADFLPCLLSFLSFFCLALFKYNPKIWFRECPCCAQVSFTYSGEQISFFQQSLWPRRA